MAYWWVTHGKTWREELDGGYLWAPVLDNAGHSRYYHRNLASIADGDLVFSYANGALRAIGVATSKGAPAQKPIELGGDWSEAGLMVRVNYLELPGGYPIRSMRGVVDDLARIPRGPLDVHGRAKQGYAFALPPRLGRAIVKSLGPVLAAGRLKRFIVRSAPSSTLRSRLRAYLRPTSSVRTSILEAWHGKCPVTGLDDPRLLKVARIKPWLDGNTRERLESANYLPLAPHYARAFHVGLLTVNSLGVIVFSSKLSSGARRMFALADGAKVIRAGEDVSSLFAYHMQHVFLG